MTLCKKIALLLIDLCVRVSKQDQLCPTQPNSSLKVITMPPHTILPRSTQLRSHFTTIVFLFTCLIPSHYTHFILHQYTMLSRFPNYQQYLEIIITNRLVVCHQSTIHCLVIFRSARPMYSTSKCVTHTHLIYMSNTCMYTKYIDYYTNI